MKYIIREQECGYLLKNGVFVRLLTAGKYRYMARLGYDVKIVSMTGAVDTCGIPAEILMRDLSFASRVILTDIPDTCLGIRFVNDAFKEVLNGPRALYWNVFEKVEIRLTDISNPYMEGSLLRIYLDLMPVKYYKKIAVKDGELGLLYFDGRLEKRLPQGVYYFWNYGKEVTCKIFNLKMQQLEISGQEILTADKVGIRLNAVCAYRISDPERLVQTIEGASAQLYTASQLCLREYVGQFRLDELLAQKEEIGRAVCAALKEKESEFCVEILGFGIKDVILPGEIREIMNTVLVAEKKAQANVIMRREEVASTRSLLNTARLMDENKTLLRLKEMEYLERICDKVGTITLNGGNSLLEQLSQLTTGQNASAGVPG